MAMSITVNIVRNSTREPANLKFCSYDVRVVFGLPFQSTMASPAKRTVELFYDVVSPYTWIAFESLCRYRNVWNIELKLKPFFLGGIMKGSDNQPPGMVPNKGKYMARDLKRLAQHYQLPIRMPANPVEAMFVKGTMTPMRFLTAIDLEHPEFVEITSRSLWHRIWSRNPPEVLFVKGSMKAMRFLTAVDIEKPEFVEALSRALFQRVWRTDEDITEHESLLEAAKVAGMTEEMAQHFLSQISSQKVKDRLKQYTDEALDHGAFGSPTMMVEDDNNKKRMVFGSDRMPIIAQILGEKYDGPMNQHAAKL